MEYIVSVISRYASFFDSYGNWILIPLFLLIVFSDRVFPKKKLNLPIPKWVSALLSYLVTIILGATIYMVNFPLKPMIESLAKVQNGIGKPVQEFEFTDVRSGKELSISDFQGNVILLNFWGTYCGPCIQEFPDLRKIESENEKVHVIALSDENHEKIKAFVERIESPEIVGSFLSEKWINLETFRPVTILIDKSGVIREYMFGRKDYETFQLAINKYL